MSEYPPDTGIYPCIVKTHAGPESHCCLWDGEQWLWLDSSLSWDPVGDANCQVLAWNLNLPDTVSKAVYDVMKERHRQGLKWGGPEHDDEHTPDEWECFIVERIAPLTDRDETFRKRMVEVSALALAAIESFDRKLEEHEALMREGRAMTEENRPRQGE